MVPSTLLAKASDTDAVPSVVLVLVVVAAAVIVVDAATVVVAVVAVVVVVAAAVGVVGLVVVVDGVVVTKFTTSAKLLCIDAKSNVLSYTPIETPSVAKVTNIAMENQGSRLLRLS